MLNDIADKKNHQSTSNYHITTSEDNGQFNRGIYTVWNQILSEIKAIFDYSYSRIAYRIGVSPSAIQKLVKFKKRKPGDKTFFRLSCFYYKLFYGSCSTPTAKSYVAQNNNETLCHIVYEFVDRGFLDLELHNSSITIQYLIDNPKSKIMKDIFESIIKQETCLHLNHASQNHHRNLLKLD